MRYLMCVLVLLFASVASVGYGQDVQTVKKLSEEMQSVSVMVKSNTGSGSGVVVLRKPQDSDKVYAFILTAAHVVDGLEHKRTVVVNGENKTVVSYDNASVLKEFREDGVTVGQTELFAKVIRFKDTEHDDDLALLRVLQTGNTLSSGHSTKFYLSSDIPPTGIPVYHCGSILGQVGANSLTSGIISQIGRVIEGKPFDQLDSPANRGSSGGAVFIVDKNQPVYVGMVTMGYSETFGLMIPVRCIVKWCQRNNAEWLIDENKPVPTLEEIDKLINVGESNTKQSSNILPIISEIPNLHTQFLPNKTNLAE